MGKKTQITGETKSDRFRRLANLRMNKSIKYIKQIGDLASPASEYTTEQTEEMRQALLDEIQTAFDRFGGKKSIGSFKLTT